MKKVITANGVEMEFTTCTFEFEGETINGLYIHKIDDENCDGDGVIGNGCEMPGNAEDAEMILTNEYLETNSEILKTVKF